MQYHEEYIDGRLMVVVEDLFDPLFVDEFDSYLHGNELDWSKGHCENLMDFCQFKINDDIIAGDAIEVSQVLKLRLYADVIVSKLIEFFDLVYHVKFDKNELDDNSAVERIHRYLPHYFNQSKESVFWHLDTGMTIMYMPREYLDRGTLFYANHDPSQHIYSLKHKRGAIAIFNGDVLHAPDRISPKEHQRIILTLQYHHPFQDKIEKSKL